MKKMNLHEKLICFSTGFAGYPLLEMLWRGHTHWSMALAGGLVLLLLYPSCTAKRVRFICLKTALCITAVELLFGILFNLILGQKVWDYSDRRWNLWGQICLPYSFLWFLLGIPILLLCRGLCVLCRNRRW